MRPTSVRATRSLAKFENIYGVNGKRIGALLDPPPSCGNSEQGFGDQLTSNATMSHAGKAWRHGEDQILDEAGQLRVTRGEVALCSGDDHPMVIRPNSRWHKDYDGVRTD